jgi:uncharacterized delta-60 repeat protein
MFKAIVQRRSSLSTLVALCFLTFAAGNAFGRAGDVDRSFGLNGIVSTDVESGNTQQIIERVDRVLLVPGFCVRDVYASVTTGDACVVAYTQKGARLTTFGVDGKFAFPSAPALSLGVFTSALLQDGDSFVVGGSCTAAPSVESFCFLRVNRYGLIDTTFGQNGLAIVPVPWTDARIVELRSLVQLPGGKFAAVGDCGYSVCVARLSANGALDGTFGTSGVARIQFFSFGYNGSSAVSATAGGALTVASTCASPVNGFEAMCVTRLTETGAIDTTFGNAGNLLLQAPGSESGSVARALSPLSAERVLVAGDCYSRYYNPDIGSRFCAVVIDKQGTVDASFGTQGWFVQDLSFSPRDIIRYRLSAAAVNFQGMIALVGYCQSTGQQQYNFCALNITPSGQPNFAFGLASLVSIGSDMYGGTDLAFGARYLGNGKLLMTGIVFGGRFLRGRLVALHGKQGFFDVDDDNVSDTETDGTLYLRHLLGYRDAALTTGALGTYADRTSAADIATYLSTSNATYPNCSASIVGAPSGPSAMLDGIVLLRAMFGLTGTAVTNGINFPVGTTRTTWGDIKAHLNANCGMALN